MAINYSGLSSNATVLVYTSPLISRLRT